MGVREGASEIGKMSKKILYLQQNKKGNEYGKHPAKAWKNLRISTDSAQCRLWNGIK